MLVTIEFDAGRTKGFVHTHLQLGELHPDCLPQDSETALLQWSTMYSLQHTDTRIWVLCHFTGRMCTVVCFWSLEGEKWTTNWSKPAAVFKCWVTTPISRVLSHYFIGPRSGNVPLKFHKTGTELCRVHYATWKSRCVGINAAHFLELNWKRNELHVVPSRNCSWKLGKASM